MRRPSMRMALVLALLAGVAAVAGKVRRGRDAALPMAPAPSTTWPPLVETPATPRATATAPSPARDAPAPAGPHPPSAATVPEAAPVPTPAIPHNDEDDTDPRLFVGVPPAGDDPSLEPRPEAVLPAAHIEEASAQSALIADGDGAVPPAPEPTFGTAPDPGAAATAPVPVATPVEPEPDEPLPAPQLAGTDPSGTDPSGTDPSGTDRSDTDPSGAERAAGVEQPTGGGDEGDTARWIPPVAGACAPSHPVKAKLASRIFHLPGMVDYERTKPDRCYLDAAAAEADGLRSAKR